MSADVSFEKINSPLWIILTSSNKFVLPTRLIIFLSKCFSISFACLISLLHHKELYYTILFF